MMTTMMMKATVVTVDEAKIYANFWLGQILVAGSLQVHGKRYLPFSGFSNLPLDYDASTCGPARRSPRNLLCLGLSLSLLLFQSGQNCVLPRQLNRGAVLAASGRHVPD